VVAVSTVAATHELGPVVTRLVVTGVGVIVLGVIVLGGAVIHASDHTP
jgi:hypothetical protein